jgi:branched-chain amino acid aminotransferase
MSKTFLPFAYHQKSWKPFDQAQISIATHALHYGTAAFGGMRAFPHPNNPQEIVVFRLDRHAHRLAESAKFFGYDFSEDDFKALITTFVQKNKPSTPIYIRPLIYTSDLDLSPRLHDIEWDTLIYGLEM